MRRGTLRCVSSTENPGDGTQQVLPSVETTPETAMSEPATAEMSPSEQVSPDAVTPEVVSSDAVTPEAGTPAAVAPADAALADPTGSAPADGAAEQAGADGTAEQAGADGTAEQAGAGEEPGATAVPAPPAEEPAAEEPAEEPAPPAGEAHAAAVPARPAAPETPVEPSGDPTRWGRVDEDGTVYVRTTDGERAVGSWQAGDPAAGLAHYARRYDDLATEVSLLEARLKAHTGNPTELKAKAQALADSIPTATAVGDLDGLAARALAMVGTADSAAAESRAEKAAARAAQIARKEALAAEAEQIAAESTSWKAAGDRLKAIVEEWKTIRGIDRKTDEALWTRFAAARDAFGRRRGAHFAQLDAQRNESRAAKQELIAEAQRLSTSTDWGPTSAAMRSLMDRWKAVPRTGRDGDDDLWKQFRAAQDVFFTARSEQDRVRNAEQLANQQSKEEILAEAEKLDPSTDLRGAQNALRKLQERYDAIGHVPRGAMRALEDRMQAVEQRVRGAVDAGRARTAPENPLLTSMRAAVTKAEEQLTKAEAAGDPRRIEEARANLATRREWLTEAEKSAGRR
jgi:Domain of Unknown Function (DUF349)